MQLLREEIGIKQRWNVPQSDKPVLVSPNANCFAKRQWATGVTMPKTENCIRLAEVFILSALYAFCAVWGQPICMTDHCNLLWFRSLPLWQF